MEIDRLSKVLDTRWGLPTVVGISSFIAGTIVGYQVHKRRGGTTTVYLPRNGEDNEGIPEGFTMGDGQTGHDPVDVGSEDAHTQRHPEENAEEHRSSRSFLRELNPGEFTLDPDDFDAYSEAVSREAEQRKHDQEAMDTLAYKEKYGVEPPDAMDVDAYDDDYEYDFEVPEEPLPEPGPNAIHIVDSYANLTPEESVLVRRNVFDRLQEEWSYDIELKQRDEAHPYVLHEDEYFANERDYEHLTLTFYEGDDILTDDKDAPIYNYEAVIGPLMFGHGTDDPNVFYVRNTVLESEYEIVYDPEAYCEAILGLTMTPEERAKYQRRLRGGVRMKTQGNED